jgi:hypothetical protein
LDKFHFFIGNIFDDIEQIKLLINLRKKLRNKYKLKYPHWNNRFYTNLIYLGYFDMHTANLYMDSIIKPLFGIFLPQILLNILLFLLVFLSIVIF